MKRPTANELMEHPWIMDLRAAMLEYEEEQADEALSPETPANVPPHDIDGATIARQAAFLHEREVALMQIRSPSMSDIESNTPSETSASASLNIGNYAL